MAVLRLRGAPKFTAVALSPASLTGLRRGPQKQRATWSRPRKSRVEGVRSGEARRGQRSPGAGREEPGALRSPLASAGARGAPRAQSGPSEPGAAAPRVPAGHPSCKGPAPGLGGGCPSRGSAGQGAAARESARAHSRTGLGRRAGHRCHLLCGFASLDETARVDGLSKPEGCEGRAGGPLVPQPPCRFSSQRVHSVSLFQVSLCRQKKITNTPICTFPLSRVRDVRQLRSRCSPLVPPTRAGCPSPSARSGRPRPFPV